MPPDADTSSDSKVGEKDRTAASKPARARVLRPPRPRSAEAVIIPSHGVGRLMPPFQVGQVGNPSGRPRTLRDVQRLARKRSMDALTALIGVYTRPDGLLDRSADGRIVVAAASTVLKWAYGEPPTYDPTQERPETRIDLEGMSLSHRRQMLEMMERVTTVIADAPDENEDSPDFDASRFADEPLVIEAGTPEAWQPGQPKKPPNQPAKPRKPRGRKPTTPPLGRPRKTPAQAVGISKPKKMGRPKKRGRPKGSKNKKKRREIGLF
jgi:hypothetical protein